MDQVFGETITYRRGTSSVSVTAIREQSSFERIDGESGTEMEYKMLDWVILKGCIVLNGTESEPQHGDVITDASGSTYELLPGIDATAWQYNDQHKLAYRIHSIQRTA